MYHKLNPLSFLLILCLSSGCGLSKDISPTPCYLEMTLDIIHSAAKLNYYPINKSQIPNRLIKCLDKSSTYGFVLAFEQEPILARGLVVKDAPYRRVVDMRSDLTMKTGYIVYEIVSSKNPYILLYRLMNNNYYEIAILRMNNRWDGSLSFIECDAFEIMSIN